MDKTIFVRFLSVCFVIILTRPLLAVSSPLQFLHPIATVSNIKLETCYKECNKRTLCKSIGYNRRALFCQMYSQPLVMGLILHEHGIVRKSIGETPKLPVTKPCTSADCLAGQNCDVDCDVKECPEPFRPPGMTIKGNMRNVNARIISYCDNFANMLFSTCTKTGTWSNVNPTCNTYMYKYAGENTAGFTSDTSFVLEDSFLDPCLNKCNETLECFGVNYFPTNKTCISANNSKWVNADNAYFYFYSEYPITVHKKNGIRYAFTFSEGEKFCISIGTSIASHSDLELAFNFGFHMCNCGWIDDGHPYLVVNGGGQCDWFDDVGVQFCWNRQTEFDVFCKNLNFKKWP